MVNTAERQLLVLEFGQLARQLKRLMPTLDADDEPRGEYWSVYERMSDIETELECLTVAWQRRFSVIGRSAA